MIQSPAIDPNGVAAALRDVFARPEFGDRVPTWTERFAEWLERSFGHVAGGGLEIVIEVALIVVFALGVAWIATVMIRARRARRRTAAAPLRATRSTANVAERIDELFGRADAARRAGDRALALRLYFFALVVGLSRRGDLQYKDSWTYRELLERGGPSADVRSELASWLDSIDRKSFGTDPTSDADIERVMRACRERLGLVA